MSYFEVYNEKIHDLLVARDEPNQRRMPVSVLSDSIIIICISIQYVLIWIGSFYEIEPDDSIISIIVYQNRVQGSAFSVNIKHCYFVFPAEGEGASSPWPVRRGTLSVRTHLMPVVVALFQKDREIL